MESTLKKLSVRGIRKYKIASFDIEAKNWTDFLMLGFYDGLQYLEFYDIEKFLDYICRRKYANYKIFAHNGGRYDFLFLFKALKKRAEIYDINGRIFQIKIELDKSENYSGTHSRYIYLIDSFYILQFSLEKLIKAFIPKTKYKKISVDFNNLKLNESLKEHCKNDCIALFDIITEFQNRINDLGGNLKSTLAATALDLFRRRYLEIEIPTYFDQENKIRESYFGGRTEVFKKHLKNGFYYDINSLYPYVMSNNLFPVGKPVHFRNYKFSAFDIGFARIETRIIKNIPPLPYRYNDLLLFPNGRINGVYSIEFLKLLQSLDIPFRCYDGWIFDGSKLFQNYVDDLYFIRRENKDNVLNIIAKLMLNSLYGKFGQHRIRKEFIFGPSNDELIDLKLYSLPFDIFYKDIISDSPHILPAISSYVTSYAQIQLFKNLDSNTYYCDTDSIFTTQEIKTSDNLGGWKLESEISEAYFITQKMYAYRDGQGRLYKKLKGYPKNSYKNLSFNNFKNAVENYDFAPFEIGYDTIYGWKESIVRKKESILNYDSRIKSIKNVDTKRKFHSKNKSVPFIIA